MSEVEYDDSPEAVFGEVKAFLHELLGHLEQGNFETIVHQMYCEDLVKERKVEDLLANLNTHTDLFIRLVKSAFRMREKGGWRQVLVRLSVSASFDKDVPEYPRPCLIVYPLCKGRPDAVTMAPFDVPRDLKPKKLTKKLQALETETGLSGHVWREIIRLKGRRKPPSSEEVSTCRELGVPRAVTVFLTEVDWPEEVVFGNADEDDPFPIYAEDFVFFSHFENPLTDYPCCRGLRLIHIGNDSYFVAAAPIDNNPDSDPDVYWVDHECVSEDEVLQDPVKLSAALSCLAPR